MLEAVWAQVDAAVPSGDDNLFQTKTADGENVKTKRKGQGKGGGAGFFKWSLACRKEVIIKDA